MKAKLAALSALSASALLPVWAAVPTEVATAITDMGVDSKTVATGFLVASIVLAAFLFMRRGAR